VSFLSYITRPLRDWFREPDPDALHLLPTPGEECCDWDPFDGPLDSIPVGRAEVISTFGDPKPTYTRRGKVKVARSWEWPELETVPASAIPGYHRKLYMHRLAAPYFREAMRRATIAEPGYEFSRIGCFNPRHMRFDRSRPLSLHTWAIAYDINPEQNGTWYAKPGDPEPFEPGWSQRSDLPRRVVEAFESVGFEWGGRWSRFRDPMHFQLTWTRGEAHRRERLRVPLAA